MNTRVLNTYSLLINEVQSQVWARSALYPGVEYVCPYSHSLLTVVYLCHVSHYITYYNMRYKESARNVFVMMRQTPYLHKSKMAAQYRVKAIF